MKRDYEVVMSVTTEHMYYVHDANSPEEAETIADGMRSDGEQGDVETMDSFVLHSWPVDEGHN